jgi:hypothetical protein
MFTRDDELLGKLQKPNLFQGGLIKDGRKKLET